MELAREDTITLAPPEEALPVAAHVMRYSLWITAFFVGSAVLTGILVAALWLVIPSATAGEAVVYSVHRGVDLGNTDEKSSKDYYINMGVQQGVRKGMVLEVSRKLATYDLLSEKLYKEVVFPIATLKVIHAESGVAIARLDKMISPDLVPAFSPRAVMVGDVITQLR